ncbi:hypothetical protein niasHT_009590 [Heterodera trifolii]|uniref:DNA-directed DNA polymerase n=1 Tax=Heterodera trifolii TaxID=157864 RepID=A0ABD2M593_9BILA
MAEHRPTFFGQMPPFGQVAQLVEPMLVNAAQQHSAQPFCTDGTHNIQFLNGCVSQLGQPLPPLCLIVVSIEHRASQQTPAGPLPVTNCVLRTGDGHRVEAAGWQAHAGALAALCVGSAYWFTNCVARARYQRLDCWYRVSVGGPNALVIPHLSTPPMSSAHPMPPVQTGTGVSEVTVPVQLGPPGSRDTDAGGIDINANEVVERGQTSRARLPQRRAAQRAGRPIEECFVIERTTAMRNAPRNTRGEVCELSFLPLEDAERPDLLMEALIQHLLDRVLEGQPRPSLIGLQVHPPGFDRPYVIPIERLNEQSAAGIDLLAGRTITKVLAVWPLEAIRADPQSGGACDHAAEHHVSHKVQSLIRVINPDDRLCLARAVLLGLRDRETRMAGGGGRAALSAYAIRQDQHGADAADLLTNAGIALNKHTYTLDDVRQLQQWLNNQHGVGQIRLVVFEKEQEYRIVFKGDGIAARFNLCLLLERAHYNYIGRIEQLFKVPGYCIDCERRADARYHASGCKVACRLCLRFGAGYPCKSEQLPNGESSARRCNECGFVFPCDDCFNYHLVNQAPDPLDGRGLRQRRTLCQWRRFCRDCGRVAYLGLHQCPPLGQADEGAQDCRLCAGPHTNDQPCFIQPLGPGHARAARVNNNNINIDVVSEDDDENDTDEDDDEQPLRFCFFDAETSQDRPLQLNNNNNQVAQKHVPLLIVAEVICDRCIKEGISVHDGHGQRALGCVCSLYQGGNQRSRRSWTTCARLCLYVWVWDNTPSPPGAPLYNFRRLFFHSFDNAAADPVDQFLDYLTRHGPKNAHTVCIAHNGGKYDFHLVLEALHRRSMPPKRLCTTGLKIYSMKLGGYNQRRITFKDSVNFFVCQLDALVKSFNLPQHLATVKPFFPYMFIKRQHLLERLEGLPGLDYYQPDTMKAAEKRAKLLRWHAENNNNGNRFQLREQLIMYCTNDVAILRESVIRFRHLIQEHAQGLDPFIVASTAAGLALATLRRCFLPANHLVHSPEGGYLRGRRASAESQRYIRFFELEHPGAQVQCASWSVGEAHIEDTGYRVDGLWHRHPPLRPLAIETAAEVVARAAAEEAVARAAAEEAVAQAAEEAVARAAAEEAVARAAAEEAVAQAAEEAVARAAAEEALATVAAEVVAQAVARAEAEIVARTSEEALAPTAEAVARVAEEALAPAAVEEALAPAAEEALALAAEEALAPAAEEALALAAEDALASAAEMVEWVAEEAVAAQVPSAAEAVLVVANATEVLERKKDGKNGKRKRKRKMEEGEAGEAGEEGGEVAGEEAGEVAGAEAAIQAAVSLLIFFDY